MGPKIEGLQIDVRVFPNLVIYKPLKHQGEQTFQDAAPGVGGPLVGSALEKQIGHDVVAECPRLRCRISAYLGWNGSAEQRESFGTLPCALPCAAIAA
jgi:hypothetical protein